MKPKILLLDEPHPKAREIMEEVAECTKGNGWTNTYELIYTQLTSFNAKDYPCVELIACPCTGVNHITSINDKTKLVYLDDEWKRNQGLQITSTSEHTMSLILQLAKMNRMQLRGKALGIIGYGRIGQMIWNYAHTFGMKISNYDNGFKLPWATKEDVLTKSDIITLHVPLNDETRGMIGREQFDMMKQGALLVNTSRAEIVSERALLDSFKAEKLGGYADDFLNDHSDEFHAEMGKCKNVKYITNPHIAGNCLEARELTDVHIAKRIVEYIEAEGVKNAR